MKFKIIIFVFALLIFSGGVLLMVDNHTRISTEEINANPERFNGYTFRGVEFEDIVLKDVTLVNVSFDDVKMRSFTAKNVIFINCCFVATRTIDASFEGVKFVGGSFQTRGNFDDPELRTEFRYINKFDVIFDNVAFHQPRFGPIKSGNVIVKNIKDYKVSMDGAHNFISGNNLNVRIDNCNFEKSAVVVCHSNSKIYVTNTVARNGAGFISGADIFYASNSVLEGGGGGDECVIRDSEVGNKISGINVYLLNNRYRELVHNGFTYTPVLGGGTLSKFYVLGSKGGNTSIRMPGGTYYIYDVTLETPSITAPDEVTGVQAINLRNVAITGGKFRKSIVRGGQWENVKIYPEVNVEDANIENIVGYNVTFPEGNPWRGKAKNASMTVSTTPFEWPEIKVPTPEELGLIWDWPEPTGAPVQ